MLRSITGKPGPSGFGSASTAEQVTHGIDGSNLTAIVTGGASGIGLETARVLAMRNVHVIIAARNMEAANEAKQRIVKDNKAARVDVEKLDLSSIRSVKAFADNFKALNIPLNILINNAGIMFCPFQLSEDGIELQFATNHLGHFYLTNLLLDNMKETAKSSGIEGRIVNLSSVAHICPYKGGIRFHKINHKSSYQNKLAYGQSKLANILHANELSRHLQESLGLSLVSYGRMSLRFKNQYIASGVLYFSSIWDMHKLSWTSVAEPDFWLRGAATTSYVALHPSLKGVTGKYYFDCNEHKPTKQARDEALAKNLWDFSNNLVNASLKT
ncbi:Short-chain dehydrogenase TIC 32, chloroplastic [Capsicum annuum]|nr:Short-chain dehydrogenase TIC 32, chloroplastic [Capsicum annuum]